MLAALHYTGEGKLAAVQGHMLLHPAPAGGGLAVHLAALPQAGVGAGAGVQEGGHMAQLGDTGVGFGGGCASDGIVGAGSESSGGGCCVVVIGAVLRVVSMMRMSMWMMLTIVMTRMLRNRVSLRGKRFSP